MARAAAGYLHPRRGITLTTTQRAVIGTLLGWPVAALIASSITHDGFLNGMIQTLPLVLIVGISAYFANKRNESRKK